MPPPQPLPKFNNPPVVEVVLSVMLEPIGGFTAAHVGRLWVKFRDRFPKTQDQPPLESPVEQENEPRQPLGPRVQFEPMTVFKLRTWFLDTAEAHLLQVQHDRVARNWRRVSAAERYPSYDHIKESFENELKTVGAYLSENGLGEMKPRQAEITYVNHIVPGDVWKDHGDLGKVLVNWRDPTGGFLPGIEDATFSSRYVIRDSSKSFVGRLHVSVQPAVAQKESKDIEILVMTLTARGRPVGKGIPGALAFLEQGHEWIVRGFTELTTPDMHKTWERRQ